MFLMKRTLYFGPPRGFYEPKRFNDFALIDIPRRLIEINSPSKCNTEGERGSSSDSPQVGITYHYPDAGIGLFYHLIRPNRCIVNLMGTRKREMDEIMELIFEKEDE